ncbi:hypothetical protein DPEC_G00317910 [Dallia pectoralis]|uniref:Uncharacterized protein n=1 Tax=Dallia pectoralis TaxID=75939 RepID=A0ACC2FD03_DALPE|nr:hypothetical protein DPEC_G00317910 [Dallia pectoralis]
MFHLSRHNPDGGCFNGEDSVFREPGLSRTLAGLRASEPLCRQVIESPAKVFARMKARVQLERVPMEDNGLIIQNRFREERVGMLNRLHSQTNSEQKGSDTCEFEHRVNSLSPRKSPRKGLTHSHFIHTPKKVPSLDAVAQSPKQIFSLLKENIAGHLTRGSEAATFSPHTVIHTQDCQQPLPLKALRNSANIPTYRDMKDQDLEAFLIRSPRKAFSHPPAQLKLNDIRQQAHHPEYFDCGFQPMSSDGCHGEVETGNIADEESVFESLAVERLPSQGFTANAFLLKEKGQKEIQDNSCLDPTNGRGGRIRCMSTPSRVPEDIDEDRSVKATFSFPSVVTGPSETSSPASPEADPSCDSASLPPSPQRPTGLVHDPLLQHTPKISIPKKRQAVIQTQPVVQSSTPKNPLKDWVLQSRGSCVYVKGFHMDNKMPWQSNIITERISSNTLKTTSGSTYVLVGPMATGLCETELPNSLLKKFFFGFPKNWKEYVREFFSNSKGSGAEQSKGEKRIKPTPLVENTVKQKSTTSQKPKPKRSVSCSATIEPSGAKVSRSGRLLKPPLEYWKGGRVILDCDLNVTVHEGYDTFSVPNTQSKPSSRGVSQGPTKPPQALSSGDGLHQEDTSDEDSVPMRKIKAHHRPQKPPHAPPKPLPSADDNDSPMSPKRPGRACVASQRCRSDAMPAAKPLAPPSMTSTRLQGKAVPTQQNPPRRTRRSANKQGASGDSDQDEESSTAGLRPKKLLGRRRGVVREVQSGDSDARQKTPKAVKSGSEMRPGLRTRGRILESSDSRLDAQETRRRESPSDSYHVAQKNGSKATAVGSRQLELRLPRLCGKILSDSTKPSRRLSTSLGESDDDDDVQGRRGNAKAVKLEPVNTRVTRTRGRVSEESLTGSREMMTCSDSSKEEPTRKDCKAGDRLGQKTQAKLEPVKPRSTRTHGRVPEKSMAASRSLSSSEDELTKRVCPEKPRGKDSRRAASKQEKMKENQDQWAEEELQRLHEAVASIPKHAKDFWVNVAFIVSTRSAGECQQQYNSQAPTCPPPKRANKTKKIPHNVESLVTEIPRITARKGTLKRKQQVRNLLELLPKDDHDDIFNSSPMQNKRVKLPTVSLNGREDVFVGSEPQTPGSSCFPTVKTPQCLHITPGMMGSVNRNDDDKYIYQLQKRMKKCQAKLHKIGTDSKFTPSTSAKTVLRRCNMENDSSMLVWKMFDDKGDLTVDSDEEEDNYFVEED